MHRLLLAIFLIALGCGPGYYSGYYGTSGVPYDEYYYSEPYGYYPGIYGFSYPGVGEELFEHQERGHFERHGGEPFRRPGGERFEHRGGERFEHGGGGRPQPGPQPGPPPGHPGPGGERPSPFGR